MDYIEFKNKYSPDDLPEAKDMGNGEDTFFYTYEEVYEYIKDLQMESHGLEGLEDNILSPFIDWSGFVDWVLKVDDWTIIKIGDDDTPYYYSPQYD